MPQFYTSTFKVSEKRIDSLVDMYCKKCPLCNGARVIENTTGIHKCSCLIKYKKAYELFNANLPKEYHKFTKDDFVPEWQKKNEISLSRAMQYSIQLSKALKEGFGLYIAGPAQSGKTFIATLLLKRALHEGYSAYFIIFREFINLALTALRDKELAKDLNLLLTEIDFLVFADVDKVPVVKNQDIVNSILPALLKKRTHAGKVNIITASKPLNELEDIIGFDLASLLTTSVAPIKLEGSAILRKNSSLEDKFFN